MFFTLSNELINRDGEKYEFVYGQEKESMALGLNYMVGQEMNKVHKYLRFKNFEINAVEEALNRGPMFLNLLSLRGYKNILFVGHFNDDQPSWILDKFVGRVIDVQPPERAALQWTVDHNVAVQFLPIIHKLMNYKSKMTVCQPMEGQFRGIMHGLYNRTGVGGHMVPCNTQYRHGMTEPHFSLLEQPEEKFDAVVFLGVPKFNGDAFDEFQVRETFAPYCTEDFEMVDLYYGAPDNTKWRGGEPKSIEPEMAEVWVNRASWDEDVKEGRPEEFEIMNRMINIF